MAYDTDFERELHRGMQAAPAGSLFETFSDKVLRHVDMVLDQTSARSAEGIILKSLRSHRGRSRAIPLDEIRAVYGFTPRLIKDVVRDLRMIHAVPVCSSRDGDGYWLAASEDEIRDTMRPYLAQAVSELRLYRRVMHNLESEEETFRQLRLELTVDVRVELPAQEVRS